MDKIYQQKDYIVKITENYYIQTLRTNIEQLKNIKEQNVDFFIDKKDYTIYKYTNDEKIVQYNDNSKGNHVITRTKNEGLAYHTANRRRCYIHLKTYFLHGMNSNQTFSTNDYYASVKMYEKNE